MKERFHIEHFQLEYLPASKSYVKHLLNSDGLICTQKYKCVQETSLSADVLADLRAKLLHPPVAATPVLRVPLEKKKGGKAAGVKVKVEQAGPVLKHGLRDDTVATGPTGSRDLGRVKEEKSQVRTS